MSAHVPAINPRSQGAVRWLQERIESWNENRSEHTVRARHGDLATFAAHMGSPELEHALLALLALGSAGAEDEVVRWGAAMKRAKLAEATRQRRISTVLSLVHELHGRGLAWDLRIPLRRLGIKIVPYANASGERWEKVDATIAGLRIDPDASKAHRMKAQRDLVVVLLLYHSALRPDSIVRLRRGDCDVADRRVKVKVKGGAVERCPVSERCAAELERWLADWSGAWALPSMERGGSSLVDRPMSENAVNRIARVLGLGTPRGLRHAAATKVAELTHDPYAVQDLLRHAHIATSQHYVDRLAGGDRRAVAVVAEEGAP